MITAEAGLNLGSQIDFRAEPLVKAGDHVAQGAPILRDRRRHECIITAPMAGRVAELEMGAGRRLASLVLYAEDRDDRHAYEVGAASDEIACGEGSAALRRLLQEAGLWMRFRSRPFGRVPAPETIPATIFVMAVDTRPLAPDPRVALTGENAEWLQLGLRALARLCNGQIQFCQDRGPDIISPNERVRIRRVGALHPAGLAGFCIHQSFPARPDRQIWDIDAEDVAAIGELLSERRLPATRLVSVAGPGMRETLLVRCQPGADLRDLAYAHMSPGQQAILSGSVLEGQESRWLGYRDRQVTVISRPSGGRPRHWLETALRQASHPKPIIATAAVEQALGGYIPAMALLRALAVGDDEAVAELGGLSLLEEDLALVDYITSAKPRFSELLRASLDRIEANL
ncbi:Na+-transporting NADH:ubiquinone oxidoreductase subunit A [Microvirga guangxiensis]|uniref:Na+-transporting NADH:ubiquinone oxidoreductase subunit A n=1 Tax=Microvirga guangxiensis TaxID=549386 RepID=A0A1G5K9S6_9HYPH|nr:Na+-transporting NADH:ubiquinone oxidoreductase subunit A [Microvirga guangxiensis]